MQERDAVSTEPAAALLPRTLEEMQAAIEANQTQRDFEQVRREVERLQAENAGLRRELRRETPQAPANSLASRGNSHSRQVVQAMMDYAREHYQQPIQLTDVARALKMNASYLSDLFSIQRDQTFHRYLEELRLDEARKLLRDPRVRIREVANKVGYEGASSFRRAFKTRTGLSPGAWRQVADGGR